MPIWFQLGDKEEKLLIQQKSDNIFVLGGPLVKLLVNKEHQLKASGPIFVVTRNSNLPNT